MYLRGHIDTFVVVQPELRGAPTILCGRLDNNIELRVHLSVLLDSGTRMSMLN